jgi:hypothetical protein
MELGAFSTTRLVVPRFMKNDFDLSNLHRNSDRAAVRGTDPWAIGSRSSTRLDTGGPVPVVVIATYVALVGWLLLNRTAPGIRLVLVGAILNLTVIAANGGYMPVTPEALERAGHVDRVLIHEEHTFVAGSKDIVLETKETNLWPLSDILVIPDGLPFAATFSGGDILIAVGVGLLAYGAVRRGADERFEVRTGTTSESGRWTTGKDEADA